jgi:DNA-directed RNA polymerase subunit RPC12/RpoP
MHERDRKTAAQLAVHQAPDHTQKVYIGEKLITDFPCPGAIGLGFCLTRIVPRKSDELQHCPVCDFEFRVIGTPKVEVVEVAIGPYGEYVCSKCRHPYYVSSTATEFNCRNCRTRLSAKWPEPQRVFVDKFNEFRCGTCLSKRVAYENGKQYCAMCGAHVLISGIVT